MIHALHLLWIVPVAVWLGFALAAIMSAGGDKE